MRGGRAKWGWEEKRVVLREEDGWAELYRGLTSICLFLSLEVTAREVMDAWWRCRRCQAPKFHCFASEVWACGVLSGSRLLRMGMAPCG